LAVRFEVVLSSTAPQNLRNSQYQSVHGVLCDWILYCLNNSTAYKVLVRFVATNTGKTGAKHFRGLKPNVFMLIVYFRLRRGNFAYFLEAAKFMVGGRVAKFMVGPMAIKTRKSSFYWIKTFSFKNLRSRTIKNKIKLYNLRFELLSINFNRAIG